VAAVAPSPESPQLTILIPYWDLDPRYLLDAVASLENQGGPYRTIVLDNASTVALPELPPFVEVHRVPRRVTIGEVRNAGLALVETSHLLYLDADDRLVPGAVSLLLGLLREHPDAVACCGVGARLEGEDYGPPSGRSRQRGRLHRPIGGKHLNTYRLQGHPRLLAWVNAARMIVWINSTVIRTDAARATGGFPPLSAEEDWVFSALLAFQGPVVATDQFVRYYRWRQGSLTAQKFQDWSLSSAARRELRRRLRRSPAVPPLLRWSAPLLAVPHGLVDLRRARAWAARSLGRPGAG
jgi:glycosyltransferase involved in cell wall biosynthesis